MSVLTPLHADLIPVRERIATVRVAYRAKGRGSVVLVVWKHDSEATEKFNISKGTTAEEER